MVFSVFFPLHAQQFFDVADSLQINAMPDSHYLGGGVSVFDFDGDGWDDLSFPMPFDSCIFYRNTGGHFVKAPHYLNGFGESKQILWVDYDNDGDNDLAFSTFEGQYKLFQNDGNFNFTDVSLEAGLLQGVERYYGMAFGDYDRDGDLDFYVTCYNPASFEQTFSRLNHLYRNNGDGTFTNVTEEAGVGDGWKLSFQGAWFDYNMDGWPDLLVINDHSFENSLYKNNGDGTFTDVSEQAGIQFSGHNPMTISVGDFDNDGDLDVYTTNTFAFEKRAMLWVNNGDGTFTDQSEEFGVDVFAWTWGAIWLDIDNDTDQDLFVAAGHISPNVETNENYLFESFNGLFFEDITETDLFGQDNRRSYGIGRLDFNNDGFADIAVTNRYPYNMNLWQNSGGEDHYVKITLQGSVSNKMAVGSWIRVFIDGEQYTQYTLCGENYIGQDSQHRIFGTGASTTVDSVEVEYVSGHIDKYYNLSVDSHYFFTEGETFIAQISPEGPITFCEEGEVVLDAGDHTSFVWNTGHTGRYLTVAESGDYWVNVANEFGIETTSDTISVSVNSTPYVQSDVGQPLCNGDENGWIVLNNLIDVQLATAEWADGAYGIERYDLGAGVYSYTAVDVNACSTNGTVMVLEPLPLSVSVYTFPPLEAMDGSISLIINGGTPPYEVLLNGAAASTEIENLEEGVYTITVLDGNNCQYEETVLLGTTGSEAQEYDLSIFPNPVVDVLRLVGSFQVNHIAIFSSDGRLILESATAQFGELDVSGLSSGIYQLRATDLMHNSVELIFIKN